MKGTALCALCYVDEAGISNPAHEPFVVVSAVIVDADKKLVALERHLDKLVERHIPEEHRADFVFHATHLFNWGGKVFYKNAPDYPLERRLKIADDLADIPRRFKLPLTYGLVERARWPQSMSIADELSQAEKTVGQHVTAFVVCSLRVDGWMRKKSPNEVCLMIAEDNEQARSLIRQTQRALQDQSLVLEIESHRAHFPFRKIKEDPLFQPKRKSSPLQVADFCAYVFKRVAMGDDRYRRFLDPMVDQIEDWLEPAPTVKKPSTAV